jgi:lactam utilization protein B
MSVHSRAGKPAESRDAIDVPRVVLSYYTEHPDPSVVAQQVALLLRVCIDHGAELSHVKAHGALYNTAAVDASVAEVVAKAVIDVDPALRIYVQPHSVMERVATDLGLTVVREAFADADDDSADDLEPPFDH